MAYSFTVQACPLSEFARRAQMAQEATTEHMNDVEAAQSKRMVEFAILMAQEEHLGSDWVQADFSGHANDGHQPKVGKPDSFCTFGLQQTGAR